MYVSLIAAAAIAVVTAAAAWRFVHFQFINCLLGFFSLFFEK